MSSYSLELRQRITLVQNRYDVTLHDGAQQRTVAYAVQDRLKLRERITFFADSSATEVAFELTARNVVELVGTYDVTDNLGRNLATIRKDAGASLLRSSYRLQSPQRTLDGQERGSWRSLGRRLVSILGDLPWPLPIHFDFRDETGRAVLAMERKLRVRDVYHVSVQDDIDWRVAAAVAVAVDAFMNR